MKLIEILKEALAKAHTPAFKQGENSPMIKLVFYDEKYGLKDIKKRKEILRVLDRNLRALQRSGAPYKYSNNQIIDAFKYYPETDKLIGDYPKWVFFRGDKAKSVATNTNIMDKCRFESELENVSKMLMVKQKT
jgi:hypothetical protein